MKNDEAFAKQWVICMKNLFDIEDENNNRILERHEFDRFIRASTAAIMSPARVASETTEEKLDNTWNAMKAVGSNPDGVSWNDFCEIHHIIEIWIDGGLLLWELEQTG